MNDYVEPSTGLNNVDLILEDFRNGPESREVFQLLLWEDNDE